MANKSVISIKIDATVGGIPHVGELNMELGELAKAARVAQEVVSRVSMKELVNASSIPVEYPRIL